MLKMMDKNAARQKRQVRCQKRIRGNAERLRLNVFRSLKHIYAQVIDDDKGITLASASTLDKEVREALKYGGNKEAAKAVGQAIAKRAMAKGVEKVVFDRAGYLYHGRVAALADAAREAGLQF